MKKNLYDTAVCAAVVTIAALLIVIPSVFRRTAELELYAEISVDGQTEARLPLDRDTVYRASNGIEVTISQNSARISHSYCPDKLCMKNSRLNTAGETAVCLPLKTIVSISENTDAEVDGIV